MTRLIPATLILATAALLVYGLRPTARPAAEPAIPTKDIPVSSESTPVPPPAGLPDPSYGVGQRPVRRATAAPAASQRPRTLKHASARPRAAVRGILTGTASWYCAAGRSACTRGYGPGCLCAAAGPAIRAALGDWRGRFVTVSTARASVRVKLVDACSCYGSRVLDLYSSVWGGLGVPLSAGLVDVEVSW